MTKDVNPDYQILSKNIRRTTEIAPFFTIVLSEFYFWEYFLGSVQNGLCRISPNKKIYQTEIIKSHDKTHPYSGRYFHLSESNFPNAFFSAFTPLSLSGFFHCGFAVFFQNHQVINQKRIPGIHVFDKKKHPSNNSLNYIEDEWCVNGGSVTQDNVWLSSTLLSLCMQRLNFDFSPVSSRGRDPFLFWLWLPVFFNVFWKVLWYNGKLFKYFDA